MYLYGKAYEFICYKPILVRGKLSFVVYTTNVAENRCKPYILTRTRALAHTRETGWSPRTRWFLPRKRDASDRLLYLTRCQLTWSNDGRYLLLSDMVHDHQIREDPTQSHIRPLGDAELTKRVMILYRHRSENDGGFPVANLSISILNDCLGSQTLKAIHNNLAKFTILCLINLSITLLYSFIVFIKVEFSLSHTAELIREV